VTAPATNPARVTVALCLVIAVLAAIAAGAGVFARGSGQYADAVSVRGEQFSYAVDGVYAHNPQRLVAEGVGWDVVTLVLAVPALLLVLPAVWRGSLRGRLILVGLMSYFFYQYLMYAMYWSIGPLFPVFIALYTLAALVIVRTVATIDIGALPERISDRFPRKGMAAFSSAIGLLLVVMWMPLIMAGVRGDWQAANLHGMPTLVVQAMDLGMVVPIAAATAVLVWRARPWGYLLATVLAVKGVTMAAAICAMVVSAAVVEGALETGSLVIFAAATLAAGWLAARMFASIDAKAA
jgi:hypothetical protein